jgi:hypothetical protein
MMRLTRDEMLLIAGVMAALVLGAVVKQHRDQTRAAALLSPGASVAAQQK